MFGSAWVFENRHDGDGADSARHRRDGGSRLDTGELAIRGNRHAMLQLQVHILKLWGLLSIGDDNKTPHGRTTLTDVADIEPLDKSPQTAIKLKNEIQSRLAQEYVQRLSNDNTFAACERAMQPKRIEQMRAIVEFIREKTTAFDRAGFDLNDLQRGQHKYAVTLTRATKGVIEHGGGDVKLWLDSWQNAMEVLKQDERR
ncbi:hypothetical protein KC343_g396 [Hortaea werneckii]|nr:hypothetical protein KC352_g3190 [Hortaea werneckii]KAI7571250.1 hypothetical protein KC317_g1782 [Hortaea werneckii]KAI7628012.1 hypothetical protein KC346_g432 [Hortaea werneckii]KAI7637981.1 hypothetical protein KC343_g396 [Hortaea werneckii]KAI7683616.1 hypothetical protein KC319_g385 [Hortaea werneckii]